MRELRHPNRKLQPDEITALVQAYQDGVWIAELARRYGMHEQTVRAHLRRAGVAIRGYPKLSAQEMAEAAQLYEHDGLSIRQLAARFDSEPTTMRRALHKLGVKMRPRGRQSDG